MQEPDDARKAAALQKELAKLERQAKQTRDALQHALTLPEAKGLADQIDQVTKAFEKQMGIRGQLVESIEAIKEEIDQLTVGEEEHTAALARLASMQQSQIKTNRAMAESLAANSETAEQFKDIIEDLNSNLQVLPERMAQAASALDELNAAMRAGDELAENMRDSLFGLSDSGMVKLVGSLQQGQAGLKAFASNAMDMKKNVMSLGTGLLELGVNSFKFAVEQDKVFSAFRKSTGAGTEFNKMIKETEQVGRLAGVTLEESAEAVSALKNTFTDFTYLQPAVQKDIMHTTTILGEMGFSMDTQAQIWQTANKSMGLGIKETQQFMLDLTATARGLGVDVNKMGQDFIANKEILSRYGATGTQVFKDMAVQAKALGIEVGTLLGFVDKFKTFDQAGTSVGRLNAIMGGPFLNSIDMLNAAMEDPVEGIRMMKSAIDQAGISAENLSGAEVMAFADALGLSAEDTRKMLSQSNEELEQQTMSMKEAAAAGQNMQNMTDQLKNAFKQLYLDAEPFVSGVLLPMIRGFASFMGWIGEAINSLGTFGSTALFVGTMIAGLMIATGVGSPFGIAALAVLGGAATGALVSSAGEGEGEGSALSKPSNLKGYSTGGRHIQGQASAPSSVAVVGENGPELAELGSAANISTASTTERLTKAMEDLAGRLSNLETSGDGAPINMSVNIAGERIDELVIKSLRSRGTRNALGPYAGP